LGLEARARARARAAAAAAGLIDAQELLVAHPPAVTGDSPQEDLAKSGYMSERKLEIYCYYWRGL
jgi:hypothetical protein